jgi:hypothetical protein
VAYRASIAPALDHPFVRLVEGVLEIQEADHDAQRHARTPGVAGDRHALHLFAKEVQVRQGRTGAALAGENLSHPRLDLLPGHARGQHGQRLPQVDHVIDARAEKIVAGGAGKLHKNSQKSNDTAYQAGIYFNPEKLKRQCKSIS